MIQPFLIRILPVLALYIVSQLYGADPAIAPLTLNAPLDWQVSQRQTRTQGSIHLAGQRTPDVRVEWRVGGKSLTGELNQDWQALALDEGKPDFSVDAAVPAGGWYRLEMRALRDGQLVKEAVVEHVGVGEIFVIAGQSNAANYGSEKQSTKTGMVASFDGQNWRIGHDPQRGAGGEDGSFMPAFGDAMNTTFQVPIGLIPLAVGATSVREWLPKGEKVDRLTTTGAGLQEIGPGQWEAKGEWFAALAARLILFGPHGCRAVLWHQGESDAGQARSGYPPDRQISGDDYARYMTKLVLASRHAAGWEVPWFTAQTTYHNEDDVADPEFRAAQKSLWEKMLTQEGPDTDALRADYRSGVHFNARGLQRHGQLWAAKVSPWLETQIR